MCGDENPTPEAEVKEGGCCKEGECAAPDAAPATEEATPEATDAPAA
ncbi:hypothetical protein HOF56_02175 [Candidatus Peribacteria bacterium]|jgi:hypothetical protein|nr:hypothetical protein [Candidatus Peribacteria bacterium]MBT4021658.1 hypothetical protein [Candidatus Peribacteria bacterium]MBT4240822.1 hypothetical protein [Candidatus Peribacteria bacterium]MBT4474149.1 hypothetical protein [Candidatus Peribacteria bacterium]